LPPAICSADGWRLVFQDGSSEIEDCAGLEFVRDGLFLRKTQDPAARTTAADAATRISTTRCPEPPECVDVVVDVAVEEELVVELPDARTGGVVAAEELCCDGIVLEDELVELKTGVRVKGCVKLYSIEQFVMAPSEAVSQVQYWLWYSPEMLFWATVRVKLFTYQS